MSLHVDADGNVTQQSDDPDKWPNFPKLLDVVDTMYCGRWYAGAVVECNRKGIRVSYKGGGGYSRVKARDVDDTVARPGMHTDHKRSCRNGKSREQQLTMRSDVSVKAAVKRRLEEAAVRKEEEKARKKAEAAALKEAQRLEREEEARLEEAERNRAERKYFLGAPVDRG